MQVSNERLEARHAVKRLADPDRVAALDVALRNHAVDRRADLRIVEFEAGEVVRRAQGLEVVLQLLEVAFGQEPLPPQVFVALEVAFHLAQPCAGFVQFQAQPVAIETRQYLALFHFVAFLDEYFTDFAFNLGDHVGFGECLDWRRTGIHGVHVAAHWFAGLDGDGRDVFFVFLVAAFFSALLARTQQQHAHESRRANAV